MEEKGINVLEEPIIQHIQSFLNGKEAARTTLLSKSWYNAWLTRPSLDFNFDHAHPDYEEYTSKTMQRYRDLNLNIQNFRLRIHSYSPYKLLAHNLIVEAIKMGATDLELDMPSFTIQSAESIVRLSLTRAEIHTDFVPYWPCLKSLSLDRVSTKRSGDVVFRNIISSCCASIEELSLSMSCYSSISFTFSPMCLYELHKLKSLFLSWVRGVDNTFFSDFASKFPCLKDLSLLNCTGYTSIDMVSNSLECIKLVQPPETGPMDMFYVPNIRKFTYSRGTFVPSLSVYEVSSTRKWEFDISIRCCRFPANSWFLRMKNLLENMRLSTITISLFLSFPTRRKTHDKKVNNKFGAVPERVAPERVAVESLTFEAPSEFCSGTLLCLLGICCPKFITHYWLPEGYTQCNSDWKINNETLCMLCNVLLSANQNTFGLNEVKVEIYEEVHKDEWRPLVLEGPLEASKPPVKKCKVRFRLTWG